jgi:hypothetical protein
MSEFVNEEPTEKVPDEIASMFDLKQKKKKKKKKVDEEVVKGTSNETNENSPNDPNISSTEGCVSQEFVMDPALYSYSDLLQRAVDFLHQHNPEYTEKRRHTMKPPQLMRGRRNYFSKDLICFFL